ncbi:MULTISPECIES: hypothetical protein [Bacillaceae]|nr:MULTISPECIES: hypothetical protein [Bacillaceae]
MGMITIDIDKLLEATADLTSEKGNNKVNLVEIDSLLDSTKHW